MLPDKITKLLLHKIKLYNDTDAAFNDMNHQVIGMILILIQYLVMDKMKYQ